MGSLRLCKRVCLGLCRPLHHGAYILLRWWILCLTWILRWSQIVCFTFWQSIFIDLNNLLTWLGVAPLFFQSWASNVRLCAGHVHIGRMTIYGTYSLSRTGHGERAAEIESLFGWIILCCIPLHCSPDLFLSLLLIHRRWLFLNPYLRCWGGIAMDF